MSGQVWKEMPGIISPLVLCSIIAVERDFRASREPNLLPVEAVMVWQKLPALLEKRQFCTASINTTSCAPGRCLLSLTLLAASNWRALLFMLTFDLLTTCLCNRGMWKWVSVCGEVEHLCEVWVLSSENVFGLWRKRVSRRTRRMWLIVQLFTALVSYEAVVRRSNQGVWTLFHVDGWICPTEASAAGACGARQPLTAICLQHHWRGQQV